jgi:PAS domain S-box-containing protein
MLTEIKTEILDAKRKTELALEDSERRYSQLLASTTNYVYTVTVDRRSSVATTHGAMCEVVTGYTSLELHRDSTLWHRMIFPEDRNEVLAQVGRVLDGQFPAPLEHRILHKDGTVRWIRNTVVPQKDNYGVVTAYNGVISDITARKKSEEQLQVAYSELAESELSLKRTLLALEASYEELKTTQLQLIQAAKLESVGTLAAGVAHEVKNPLQTILLGLDYLRGKVPADEASASTLNDMREAVKRADAIVRELLQFSRTTKFEMSQKDLNQVIGRSLRLINSDLLASRVNVVSVLAKDLPPVPMDSAKVEQVFLNLFINAMQAMPGGGTLTVTTRAVQVSADLQKREPLFRPFKPLQTVVVAEVHDTGSGLTEASLAKLFSPFFTTKAPGVGTGLGLPVAKRIIDLHGGAVDVRNAPQGGALATLVLNAGNGKTS